MNVIAVNGGPRKKWNTATLLEHALEGAKSAGAQTRLVHLYDLDFKGCISCFECKKIGGKSYGHCAYKDGLSQLLADIAEADAFLLGSPIYFRCETGETRSFLERLLFPYVTYTPNYERLFPRDMPTGLIYTMNVPEDMIAALNMDKTMEGTHGYFKHVFGSCEMLQCTDTLQFNDYSKYLSTRWDPVAKGKRRNEVFPLDCAKAFDMGRRLAEAAKG